MKPTTDSIQLAAICAEHFDELVAWVHASFPNDLRNAIIEVVQNQIQLDGNPDCFQGLECQLHGSRVCAGYWVRYPGQLGILSGPRWIDEEGKLFARLVVRQLCNLGKGRGLEMMQSVLSTPDADLEAALIEGGLRRLTTLTQMQCHPRTNHLNTQTSFSDHSPIDMELHELTLPINNSVYTMERVDEHCYEELTAVIEATYEGTLDCPELNGLRSAQATLEGYRASAGQSPPAWWLLRTGSTSIGCLLLSQLEANTWELTYMGIIRDYRSRGLGQAMVEFAKRYCAANSADVLSLAVDQRNSAAIRAYTKHGFTPIHEVQAFIYPYA